MQRNTMPLITPKTQITQPPSEIFHSGFGDRSWLKKHGKKNLIVFNDQALLQLRKYFNSLDEKGTGSIGVDELEDPFIALGLSQTREEVQELIDSVDEDGSGKIEFGEFLSIMSKIRKGRGDNKKQKSAIYDFFQKMSSGNLGEDMDKNLPFRLNVSQYRRRRILESIMGDTEKKEKGNKILQAFKRQISVNPNLRETSMDAKKVVSTTGGLTMYSRIVPNSRTFSPH